jgi:hypothetical protein
LKGSADHRFRPPVDAKLNTDRFAPVVTKKLRFTIRATNNLEPCLDEVEIFDATGANVARKCAGTSVTSSGDTVVADRHELRFVNDGEYGNSRSWMSNEVGKGWVLFEFNSARTIDRVVWGRDRQGRFADRLATNYLIEVADSSGKWRTVADSLDRAAYSSAGTATGDVTAGLSADDAKKAIQWRKEKQSLEARIAVLAEGRLAFAGTFRKPDDIHFLSRGDPEQPKDRVAPAVLRKLGSKQLSAESPRLVDQAIAPIDRTFVNLSPSVARRRQGRCGRRRRATPVAFSDAATRCGGASRRHAFDLWNNAKSDVRPRFQPLRQAWRAHRVHARRIV